MPPRPSSLSLKSPDTNSVLPSLCVALTYATPLSAFPFVAAKLTPVQARATNVSTPAMTLIGRPNQGGPREASQRRATFPVRCGLPSLWLRSENSRCPPSSQVRNATFDGRYTGSLNETSTVKRSGSCPSSAARQRALVHIPCASGRGTPTAVAVARRG